MTVSITTVAEARRRLSDYLVQDRPLNEEEEKSLLVCLNSLEQNLQTISAYLGHTYFHLPPAVQSAFLAITKIRGVK